jgi:NAD(P)-dependent dehydrogenase (short-subunit alcohol dehydrogenase family)
MSNTNALPLEIQAMGRRAIAVTCDVTDVDQVQHMATTLLAGLGGLDILVNNAGNAGSHFMIVRFSVRSFAKSLTWLLERASCEKKGRDGYHTL